MRYKRQIEDRFYGQRTEGIGLAMLRLDGFASLAASFDGGRVTTRPFALNGNELWVNAKADYGQLTVELLDGEEKPIPGYAAEDCVALAEDGVAIPVRWRGDGGLSALGGHAGSRAVDWLRG